MMMRKTCTALLLAAVLPAAHAAFPDHPITLIVPFPAGGPTDIVGRVAAAKAGEILGQQSVVENRTGASGTIGMVATARAKPDGHTLVMAQTDNIVLNPWLYNKLSYDTFKDFKPVGLVASSPSVFVVVPESPYKTLDDVVKAARARPGQVSLGIPGIGGSGDLIGHLWRKAAGMELMHRPHRPLHRFRGIAVAADPRRQGPRAGRGGRRAFTGAAGCADLRGKRRARVPDHALVRRHGAGSHAGGHTGRAA
ncbi:hypothetical protein G6F40_013397 [Rhizopus arrhizus]|nr:hypothetical protein G6F40_013397 [Rhizopus arrhizus]